MLAFRTPYHICRSKVTAPSYPLIPSFSLPAFRFMDLNNSPASASQEALSIGTYQGSYFKVAFWRVVSQVWFLLLQTSRPPALLPSAGVCLCITLVQSFMLSADLHLCLQAYFFLVPRDRGAPCLDWHQHASLYTQRLKQGLAIYL